MGVLRAIARGAVRAIAVVGAVFKPVEQMNAQTTLPPSPFPGERDEYRP
jgi:hypothetical protein